MANWRGGGLLLEAGVGNPCASEEIVRPARFPFMLYRRVASSQPLQHKRPTTELSVIAQYKYIRTASS